MAPNTIKRIQKLYAAAVTVITILAGLCLMAACLGIYLSGDKPFSREAVGAAFSTIAIVEYLCLGVVILGFVLEWLLPKQDRSVRVLRQHKRILSRLYATKDLQQGSSLTVRHITQLQSYERIWQAVTIISLGAGILAFVVYLLSEDRFLLDDINGCVIRATVALLICMSVPFACATIGHYQRIDLMEQQIVLLKELPALADPHTPPAKATPSLLLPRLVFLAAAIALLVYGFFTGGTADVLVKAINICTECVGLG